MTVQRSEYEIFADYFQFYLQDESAEGNLGDSWTEEAVARMLAIAPCTVGIGTVRNMDVPVTVEVLDNEPSGDFEEWDHVVECTLEIPSGRIVVAGCTDYFPEAARVEVVPGVYRARVSYGGLDALSDDGLDGNDHYRIQLWRADAIFGAGVRPYGGLPQASSEGRSGAAQCDARHFAPCRRRIAYPTFIVVRTRGDRETS